MNRSRRFYVLAALVATGSAGADTVHEAGLKAKLTYNLARFAQWPASTFALPADPLVVCLPRGDVALTQAFVNLGGQVVAGRPLKVVVGAEVAPGLCHVLFVQEVDARSTPPLSAVAVGPPSLTIGDGEGFVSRGGMVELVNVNDSLRFDVNLGALRAAQIGLSSQVLKLARQVRE